MLAIKKPVYITEITQAITKAIKVVRNPKRFSDFAVQSDFSFAIIDKISVIPNSFFDCFKVPKFSQLCEKINGLFLARRTSSGKDIWK